MAGIGFELKKLFNRQGFFASFRAYGYAGVVCTGPMLLGIVLLLGVMYLCDKTGGSRHSRDLLVCMITYTLLFSLTVTSFLSMVVTRFIADMLYEEKYDMVLPSFWGSTGIMLVAGGIQPLMPWLLSFAAGAMMYVVVEELIPEAHLGEHSNVGTLGVMGGFVVMMILDVALG